MTRDYAIAIPENTEGNNIVIPENAEGVYANM
jgi:hypothetical protein